MLNFNEEERAKQAKEFRFKLLIFLAALLFFFVFVGYILAVAYGYLALSFGTAFGVFAYASGIYLGIAILLHSFIR